MSGAWSLLDDDAERSPPSPPPSPVMSKRKMPFPVDHLLVLRRHREPSPSQTSFLSSSFLPPWSVLDYILPASRQRRVNQHPGRWSARRGAYMAL